MAKVTNEQVLEAVNKLTETLTPIAAKLDEFLQAPAQVVSTQVDNQPQSVRPEVKMAGGFPIPFEYTELVNTILNKKFEIDINYLPDQAAFEFSVLVPQEYSNAGDAHWNTFHEDRRSKVILNAYGANGVREWLNHVYDNFTPEIKSKITFDRAQI